MMKSQGVTMKDTELRHRGSSRLTRDCRQPRVDPSMVDFQLVRDF